MPESLTKRGPPAERSSIRCRVDPRDVPAEKAARRLHLTLAGFESVKADLFARGFPKPDPTTGMYDLLAIEAWMDARSGLSPHCGLTGGAAARNAQEVFGERARRLLNG
jgi:hypothetical protein